MTPVMKYAKTTKQVTSPQQSRRIFPPTLGFLRAAALIVVSFIAGSIPALAQFSTELTLINGWTGVPVPGPISGVTQVASVREVSGIVHFSGAINTFANNTNMVPFVLPAGFTPATDVYIPVDLCNATNGRLHITPSGVVDIEAENGALSNAKCFTSLDGASFAPTDAGFTTLAMMFGWTDAPYGTSNAAVEDIDGIVHLKGAVATFANNTAVEPFVIPPALAPATELYIPLDLCNATNGRLHIWPSGLVNIDIEDVFTDATCFTSFDGASYATTDAGFTPLTLINGWTNAPFNTSNAAVKNINGVVHFKGAISTFGNSAEPFVLPAEFTPATDVYIKVALCDMNNGRLHITPSGIVDVEVEAGMFNYAQCFTSLDGASFALPVFNIR